MLKYILPIALIAAVLVSCGGQKKPQGTVLAKVNDQVLTLEDVLYQLPPVYRDQFRGKDLQDAVDNWINTQLLYQQAVKAGADKDPEVQAVIRFRTTDAVARHYFEKRLADTMIVTPNDVDSAFEAQRESFKLDKDRLRASHILVGSKEEAEGIYNRLKKGDDFSRLASEYSLDRQTSASGGDLGYFTADLIDPAFAAAALKLKIGEFSVPVKTPYGYHIIMLTDHQTAGASVDSVEVKSKITEDLVMTRQNQYLNDLLASLKKEAKIEKFSPPEAGFPALPDSE